MKRKQEGYEVVRAFVETDRDLVDLVREASPDGRGLVSAIRLLLEFAADPRLQNGAFLAARKVSPETAGGELGLLFLCAWAQATLVQAASRKERMAPALGLVRHAEGCLSPDIHPAVAAQIKLAEAKLSGMQGNRRRQESLLREAVNLLPPSSPRRRAFVLELADMLAHAGGLDRLEASLPEGSAHAGRPPWTFRTRAVELVNAVETGRWQQADTLLASLGGVQDGFVEARAATAARLLPILRPLSPTTPPPQDATTTPPSLPDWALVLKCLSSGQSHQALSWARLCEKRQPAAITGTGLASLNLLRAELCENNAEAARRILRLRRDAGNAHELDGFFRARAALLQGDEQEAAREASEAAAAAERHASLGRLEFEARLALEMPRDVLLRLFRRRASPPAAPAHTGPPPPATAAPAPAEPTGLARLIGKSRSLQAVRDLVRRVAPLDAQVLISGETGTGKELVARAVHEEGPRRSEPFVAVNCGAISDALLESELFGHEKGAFTGAASARRGLFEEAGAGTVLLDEIGDISPRLQVALLRVLESGEFRPVGAARPRRIRCRILASTNADIAQRAAERTFRRDLLFRLSRLEIRLAPLRERAEDILPLAVHFLNEGRPAGEYAMMSSELMSALRRRDWPGNVRELRNLIERLRLLNSDKLLYERDDLEAEDGRSASSLPPADPPNRPPAVPAEVHVRPGRSRLRRLETLRALFREHPLLTRAEIIRALGVSPNTATRDLRTLCNEGFVRRVAPTASPRSVHFERADGGGGDGAP